MTTPSEIKRTSSITIKVDLNLHSKRALLEAAHRFSDRCHTELLLDSNERVSVVLQPKSPDADLDQLRGDFINDLHDQTLRLELKQETEPIRRLIIAHAFSETSLLHPELETNE